MNTFTPEEGIRPHCRRLGVTMRLPGIELGTLEEQPVLLIAEPPLQPHARIFNV